MRYWGRKTLHAPSIKICIQQGLFITIYYNSFQIDITNGRKTVNVNLHGDSMNIMSIEYEVRKSNCSIMICDSPKNEQGFSCFAMSVYDV